MVLVVLIILFLTFQWLKFYTNHGQKIPLPDYTGQNFEKAREDAKDKSFTAIVNDSIHVVGKPGGIILNQNPKPGAEVKENRKIYFDITKYTADEYSLQNDLPTLYGQEYDRTKAKLSSLQLEAIVKDRRADKGVENHILEVWYNGRMVDGPNGKSPGVSISKGGKLEFVVSQSLGHSVPVPDWTCKRMGVVKTLARFKKIKLGQIEKIGAITNIDSAFIVQQFPPFDPLSTMKTGQSIDIIIQSEKPENCN